MNPIHVFMLLCIGNIISAKKYKFSKKFKFGAGTSAYQVEGAWNESGKGESIWDRRSHANNLASDEFSGDIACDSYHKYKEDIEMLKELKVECYRFSLSWTRLFPMGTVNELNQAGLDYYNNLIDGLVEANIEPFITLFHWDTPQILEDMGGWNSAEMVTWFTQYADKVFELFGDRVKKWVTLNEPSTYCYTFHSNTGVGTYLCGHNQIKAHASVYRMYTSKYKKKQKGKVGISLLSYWAEPKNPKSKKDKQAAKKAMDVYFGWFAGPIFINGDYPKAMKKSVAKRSKKLHFSQSRLPEFTDEEKMMVYQSADFLGLNFYSTVDCTPAKSKASSVPTKDNDDDILLTINPNYNETSLPFYTITPEQLKKLLIWINKKVGTYNIIITENGYNGDEEDDEDDTVRIEYLKSHLQATLEALKEGVKINGYIYWSLMDNFDWNNGYTRKFGLYSVDFNDPERPRTPRKSAKAYQEIIETRKFKFEEQPEADPEGDSEADSDEESEADSEAEPETEPEI